MKLGWFHISVICVWCVSLILCLYSAVTTETNYMKLTFLGLAMTVLLVLGQTIQIMFLEEIWRVVKDEDKRFKRSGNCVK